MRVETIAGHITQGPPHSQFYLIQPNASPFAYKQFRYFMNGTYTVELFLYTTYECKFRSALTNITTQWHGNWRFCEHCQGINAYFDLEERPDKAIYKWTSISGTEGIDYKGRLILVFPKADWNVMDRLPLTCLHHLFAKPRNETMLRSALADCICFDPHGRIASCRNRICS